jgi:hypothetical protein
MKDREWFKRWRSDDGSSEEQESRGPRQDSGILGRMKSLLRRGSSEPRWRPASERSILNGAGPLSHGLF